MDWALVVGIVSCAALIITAAFLQRGLKGASPLQRVAYALFPASQLLAAIVLYHWIIVLELSEGMTALVTIVVLACCPIDIVLFRNLRQAQEREFSEARLRMLTEQLEVQEQYHARLEEDMGNIDRIRANAEREFQRASELLAEGSTAEACSALADAGSALGTGTLRFCDNPIIDVIADVKYADCQNEGIDAVFALEVPRRTPAIPEVELCAVFSNLIDNALDAAKALRTSEAVDGPFVEVSSEVRGNVLAVTTRNSASAESLHALEERSKARKRFKSVEDRGWGLSIVEEIAARHGGALTTSVENGMFHACAILVLE